MTDQKQKTSQKPWGLVISVLLLLMLVGYFYHFTAVQPLGSRELPAPFQSLEEKVSMKDFDFKIIGDEKIYSLKDFEGEWVVLNFWATWCPPCIKELPTLETLSKDVKVVAISLDTFKKDTALQDFIKNKVNVTSLPLYHDYTKQIYYYLKPAGLPVTFLIHPSGAIVGVYRGEYDWSRFDRAYFSSNK